MDQSCVSLLSGRVGGISLKAGHRTHSGHTVPFAPTAFPTEANHNRFLFLLHKGTSYGSNQPIVTVQCLTALWPGKVV